MADADRFVTGGRVRWGLLVSTLVSSLILQTWGGVTRTITGYFEAGAILVSTYFDLIYLVAITAIRQPAATVQAAWSVAAQSLPGGPLAPILVVILIALTWEAQLWAIRQAKQVIQ